MTDLVLRPHRARGALRRRFTSVAAFVGAAALLAGCAGGGGPGGAAASELTGEPVRIVSINDDTADHPEADMIAAGEAAVDYVNENGGINGRPLEIEFCNGQLDPNATAACANQAVSDPSVIATVGNFMVAGSGATSAFTDAGLAQINIYPVGSSDYNCEVCFLANGGSLGGGIGAAMALNDVRDARQIALVSVDTPNARGIPDVLNRVLESTGREGRIVSSQFAPYGSADFTGIVAGLQSSGADGVYLGLPLNLQLSFLRAASSLGLQIPISTNLAINLLPELASVGPAADNLIVTTFYRRDLPGYEPFRERVQDLNLDVGWDTDTAANTWDGVLLLADLARATPEPTRESILAGIRAETGWDSGMMAAPVDFTRTFDGLEGNFTRWSNGNVYYAHVENGEVVYDLDARPVDIFASVTG